MKKFGSFFSATFLIVVYILLGLYHLWTVILALSNYGIVWGILAFCAPIVSELLMNGIYIGQLGFINTYTLAIISIFILYGMSIFAVRKFEQHG
jgi:hypothetical protein